MLSGCAAPAVQSEPGAATTARPPAAASSADGVRSSSAGGECAPVDPADTSTPAGWLGYLANHHDDVSVIVDDGRGHRVEHRPGDPAPAASAAKVLHLAAYADAIDSGKLSPDQRVVIADWEAWFLPGLDGGAHGRALQAVGVPNDGVQAVDPTATVRLDDIVTAMIQFSDNAAADFLRDLLGDDALRTTAAEAGASTIELPSYLGAAIALLAPADAPPPAASREEHEAAELALARRYVTDQGYRAQLRSIPAPGLDAQLTWADSSTTTTAFALAKIHGWIYARAADPADPGAANARGHLEWPPVPAGAIGLGAKGGAYPGVITEAMTLRQPAGVTASAVLLVRRMPAADWTTALSSFAHQELLLAAMQDPAVLDRLSCAVGAGSIIPG